MTGADNQKFLFAVSPLEAEHRSHYANMSARLTDETIAHASSWCEQTPITANDDTYGPVGKLISQFVEHTVAQALADDAPELLPVAARAGLLMVGITGDNPRARLEGARDRALALVIEAALQLGTTFEAVMPTEPPDVIHRLVAQTKQSHTLGNTLVLVERWGSPLLALVWNDTRAAQRPVPFVTFDWWEDRFPWDQVGPVTVEEPTANELSADARARRLATEFARTGEVELGLESVREAIRCDHEAPAWMGLWVAHKKGGAEGMAAFSNALAAADLPAAPNGRPPQGDQSGDTIVTDPWAGPFFDRVLTS